MLLCSSRHPWGSVFYIIFQVLLINIGISAMNTTIHADIDKSEVLDAVEKLKAALRNISSYLGDIDAMTNPPPKCLRMQCRVVCVNGRQKELVKDVTIALIDTGSNIYCPIIQELHLYNYKFDNDVVPVGFLGNYTNKIREIFLGSSNITAFEDGAFGGGIFKSIVLEDLQLNTLEKSFFLNITKDFKSISIMQNTVALIIYPSFLEHVQHQIEFLSIQAGVDCIRNITASDPILGALSIVDFSHNNFGDQLRYDSFRTLTMVETLKLAYSNINYLPYYIFQDMKYLTILDISHNKLKSLSRNIFGVSDISSRLIIYATFNNWHCTCQMQQDMSEVFMYQVSKFDLICATPEEFTDLSVFSDSICEPKDSEITPHTFTTTTRMTTSYRPTTTRTTTRTTTKGAAAEGTTTTESIIVVPTISTAGTVSPDEIVPLECQVSAGSINSTNNLKRQNIKWPQLSFIPRVLGSLTVKITVDQRESTKTFGLFWFSKTTKEYYMMELLPDEFGLGCYFTMPLQTIVTNLVPNVAYTFCLVDEQQSSVSPFSCKSVHVDTNLNTYYNSWLSRRMRAKGISLMVFGIVIFVFIGIMCMFLVLKRKPVWVKGSKRIVKQKHRSGEVVVLPRATTAESLQKKENMISRINEQRSISYISRHDSLDSLASSDSYINTNLYEIIPAYISFDKVPQLMAPSQPYADNSFDDTGSVRYAQITPRTKRISSDPLPAVPNEVSDSPEIN